jgi:hypothetical protein
MQKKLCSEIQPLPRPLQANSTKSPPLPLVSHLHTQQCNGQILSLGLWTQYQTKNCRRIMQ